MMSICSTSRAMARVTMITITSCSFILARSPEYMATAKPPTSKTLTIVARYGLTPLLERTIPMYAARIKKIPWAKFRILATPNISENPEATNAHIPPTTAP